MRHLFRMLAQIQFTHIPYKGSTAAHPDLLAGRVDLMFDPIVAITPHPSRVMVWLMPASFHERS